MAEIIQQRVFESLDEFVNGNPDDPLDFGQNNFWLHFRRNSGRSQEPHYVTFKAKHPKLTHELRAEVGLARHLDSDFPYQQLWEAYQLMSTMVTNADLSAVMYAEPEKYLTR